MWNERDRTVATEHLSQNHEKWFSPAYLGCSGAAVGGPMHNSATPPPCGEHILRHYAAVFSFSNSMGCRGRQLRIIFLTNKASNSAKCNTEWSRTQNAISLQSLSKRKAVSTLRGLPLFALEHLISSICSKGQNTRNKFKTDFQHGRWLVQALLASIFVTSRTM